MAQHSFGPTCRYYESESEGSPDGDGPPKVKAQFFYISSVPIDDPLSPVPPAASEKASAKHPPQPFFHRDNAALEEAWQAFQSITEPAKDARLSRVKPQQMISFPKFTSGSKSKPTPNSEGNGHIEVRKREDTSEYPDTPQSTSNVVAQNQRKNETSPPPYDEHSKPHSSNVARDDLAKESLLGKFKSLEGGKPSDSEDRDPSDNGGSPTEQYDLREGLPSKLKNMKDKQVPISPPGEPNVASSAKEIQQNKYQNPSGKSPGHKKNWFSSETVEPQVMLPQDPKADTEATAPIETEELHEAERDLSPRAKSRRNLYPFTRLHSKHSKDNRQNVQDEDENTPKKNKHRFKHVDHSKTQSDAIPNSDHSSPVHSGPDTSSNISGRPFARAPSKRNMSKNAMDGAVDADPYGDESEERLHRPLSKFHQKFHPHPTDTKKRAFVPVGVSRLHLVEMPDLVMKPIYWSPINDQASVIRATWFFKDTMEPVDKELANRLEAGYEDMKPYSDVYQHELDSCIEHGASAEMKVVHRLWPEEKKPSRPPTSNEMLTHTDDDGRPSEVAENKTPLLISEVNAAADHREPASSGPHATHSVIYIDKKNAQILKPSLLPNELRGRKPLASIRKGRAIGVPVVRGFDLKTWEKVHKPKMTEKAAAAKVGAYISQSGDATTRDNRPSCPVCDGQMTSPQPSHLVLVIHGIGQKLSERVDSYHFTHAINSLRREFNVELASDDVKSNLQDNSGIMVLPVNWRLNISFDEEVKAKQAAAVDNKYGLADITPDTLPAVRSLISDVMLDIPYYLSHHKEKMMSAVVKEANRVYRLWCRNNPGFQENGKIYLVAHSLGSVMAMDILSDQPTKVPKNLDLTKQPVSESMFEFDTKSLFCCGSPSGFFLLLNDATLIPRRGRNKPGMEGEDLARDLAGEAGTYGCLAVDNIYNICHKNDPIAYLQNSCVDRAYSASLMPANIPSTNTGMLSKIGGALRITSGTVSNAYDGTARVQRPPMVQLPSTVELETHNFTREEIAERRMYLLNDNGQIDFFLNSAGGPLEFQYLNMLSAHSSYWILQDFVRFLVVEIGRKSGRSETLPSLRAQKRRDYKRGEIR